MDVLRAFSKEHAVAEDANHPKLRTNGLRVVVGVLDSHLVDGFVVCDREAFSAEGEEISDDGTVFLVPFSLRYTAFLEDDVEELTPEWEAGDGRDMSEFRDVEWVDI